MTLCNRKGRYFTQDFVKYTQYCTEIDNELHALNLDTSSSHINNNNTFTRRTFNNNPTTNALFTQNNDVVPMEIDLICRGPLTAQEKDRQQKEGLCLYCGQGKHFASACPNKKSKAAPLGKAYMVAP